MAPETSTPWRRRLAGRLDRSRTPSDPGGGRPQGMVRGVVAVAVLTAAALLAVTYISSAQRHVRAAPVSALPGKAARDVAADVVSGALEREPRVDFDKAVRTALAGVTGDRDARYSVAIADTASGNSAVYGQGAYDTASIVKVDILATLLLQAQDAGRPLTAHERARAEVMIENSDNAAALELWHRIGRAAGLDAANKRLGLTGTSGGSGELWGLTQTTAADQLTLLRAVFGSNGVLDASSRGYIRRLMGRVSSGQDWGVPSAADGAFEVKNGWLQRSTTSLWDINSIGRITSGGRTYLVAVVSRGSATRAGGIALVEDAAKAAVAAFTKAAGGSAAS
ncbi:serine hydrolase [Streptomyces sp. MI02-7b]|uniref:serine hydrolase n=1 Tax=Streptomyces sp. MI02-7b TaxID=462941 RepID=UPI0029BF8D1A|nr:serine hydrolase [Streptomyces sp. MI02-7b]MDX3075173.1 serine hydrolase [Streptomyces sp. MI02-7b]